MVIHIREEMAYTRTQKINMVENDFQTHINQRRKVDQEKFNFNNQIKKSKKQLKITLKNLNCMKKL